MNQKRSVLRISRRHAPGTMPGQVQPAKHAGRPTLSIFAYGPDRFEERQDANLDDVRELREKHALIWIDVSEFGDRDLILQIGELFGLHRLALEDAVNTHQRPKVEDYGEQLFLIARMLRSASGVETEQVAFFVGTGYVITFQEKPEDCFAPVRERIRQGKGRLRARGADYLAYALLDSIVDEYFPALERYGEILETLEDYVVRNPTASLVSELHNLKRDLLMLRRAIWPHREMINNLLRDDHQLIESDSRPYLRDCYDHTIQLMDIVETYREMASGLLDIYMSSVSVKLNEVMKVLTIVATIFMPISFIASLYGMNFDREASPWNMPELGWTYGYPFALLVMLASAAGIAWYAWRRGWLTSNLK